MSCTKQTSKRYTERKSPPYKAEECPGASKKGNDGLMYTSKKNSKGAFRWSKKSSEKAKKECKPGQVRNPQTGRCKKAASRKPCKPDQVRNPQTGRCKKKSRTTRRYRRVSGGDIRDYLTPSFSALTKKDIEDVRDMTEEQFITFISNVTADTRYTNGGIGDQQARAFHRRIKDDDSEIFPFPQAKIYHQIIRSDGNAVLNSMRDVIRANGGSATLSKMAKEMPKSGHFPVVDYIFDSKDFIKYLLSSSYFVDYLREEGINFQNRKFVDLS